MLTDESKMPFGKFKDTRMDQVPASYLLWLEGNISETFHKNRTLTQKELLKYIEENKQVLIKENGNR